MISDDPHTVEQVNAELHGEGTWTVELWSASERIAKFRASDCEIAFHPTQVVIQIPVERFQLGDRSR